MSKEKELIIHDSEEEFDKAMEEELGDGYGEEDEIEEELRKTPGISLDEDDGSSKPYDPTDEFDE